MEPASPPRVPRVGSLPPFIVQIASWQVVAICLFFISLTVHVCVLRRASYSLRTMIGLAGLSLFLATTTASELASQDDTGVQQLLWCLCTSILTDNYDPNTDAFAWKRVMWMLSTWVQLWTMYHKTYVAASTTQQTLFQAVVVLKGLKLHFLHGWHCSSWDETKDDSKTQCEHLTAVATWLAVDWSTYLEKVDLTSDRNGTIIEDNGPFFWRSLLEGKPRRATAEGRTIGRDCCDIAVKFKRKPILVVPAVAFSIKRQYKAKLGSMATLSAQYCYLAIGEMALASSIVTFMVWEWRTRQEKRTSPAAICLSVWCFELLYHMWSCGRAFDLADEVHRQSHEYCIRSRKVGLEALTQTCLVITDLILGSVVEALVTGLASVWKGATFWVYLSSNDIMKGIVVVVRWMLALCIVMPMGLLTIAGKKLHALWRKLRNRHNPPTNLLLWFDSIVNLEKLQDLLKDNPRHVSTVEKIMYPRSIGDTSVENPSDLTSPPVTSYSLTALEAVFFSQLLGQASLSLAPADLSVLNVWRWTSKAVKDGMIDSSWLSPNISRALWHAATFEQADVWRTTLNDVRLALMGDINPSAPPASSIEDVFKAGGEGMASLDAARRAVLHMITHLDPGLDQSKRAEWAMRSALFAVVAFCKHWGGPETVAVPGPLEHESLMTSLILKWSFDVSSP